MPRQSTYDPKFCDMLITHMRQGLSFEAFASIAGVSKPTLYTWAKEHPEFAESKTIAEAHSLLFWEKLGLAGVCGKIKGFNATSWIYNMKNRHGWRDKVELEHVHPANEQAQVHVYIPHNGRDRLPEAFAS